MSGWGLYFAFLIPPLIIGFVVQHWLKKTVTAQMQVGIGNGLTGAEVARQILDRNGLQGVPVEPAQGGAVGKRADPEILPHEVVGEHLALHRLVFDDDDMRPRVHPRYSTTR